jgi:hypothetical protein
MIYETGSNWRDQKTGAPNMTLLQELAGYEAYASRTRYQLIPAVW